MLANIGKDSIFDTQREEILRERDIDIVAVLAGRWMEKRGPNSNFKKQGMQVFLLVRYASLFDTVYMYTSTCFIY
jgi:hypothetical protein